MGSINLSKPVYDIDYKNKRNEIIGKSIGSICSAAVTIAGLIIIEDNEWRTGIIAAFGWLMYVMWGD